MPEVEALEPNWDVKVDRIIREVTVTLKGDKSSTTMTPMITFRSDVPEELQAPKEILKADWEALKAIFAKYAPKG